MFVTRGSQQACGVVNWPTSSRMRIRWASAVLCSAIGASATLTALAAGRRSMRRAIASASRRRPSRDGTTATRVPEIANVAEDAGLTIPANAGPTAAAIALRSRLTPTAPLPGAKRRASRSCRRVIDASRPAPRTATGTSASADARA